MLGPAFMGEKMRIRPVGATIAQAYSFAFRKFVPLLGIVWLPWLIAVGGGICAVAHHRGARRSRASRPRTISPAHAGPHDSVYLVKCLFLLFMQITGVMEYALDMRQGSPWFYFSLAKPVWRVIGAMLLLVLVILVLASWLLAVIGGLITSVSSSPGWPLASLNYPGLAIIAPSPSLSPAFGAYVYAILSASDCRPLAVCMAEDRAYFHRPDARVLDAHPWKFLAHPSCVPRDHRNPRSWASSLFGFQIRAGGACLPAA